MDYWQVLIVRPFFGPILIYPVVLARATFHPFWRNLSCPSCLVAFRVGQRQRCFYALREVIEPAETVEVNFLENFALAMEMGSVAVTVVWVKSVVIVSVVDQSKVTVIAVEVVTTYTA